MTLLLPCPFCGGAPEMDTQQAYRALSSGNIGSSVAIYCADCSVQHSVCREDVRDLDTDGLIALVTEAWNKRTPTANGEIANAERKDG